MGCNRLYLFETCPCILREHVSNHPCTQLLRMTVPGPNTEFRIANELGDRGVGEGKGWGWNCPLTRVQGKWKRSVKRFQVLMKSRMHETRSSSQLLATSLLGTILPVLFRMKK